jgi:adenylyltransferase/sulfurtransferase
MSGAPGEREGRHSRQVAFSGIGPEGQRKIAEARVAVVGLGALGTVIANGLARSGVGYLRLIDRDYVELSNLQRQLLYTEADAREGLPKAEAAARRLVEVDSGIELDPRVSDFGPERAEELIRNVDLVVDGTDNLETRFILNDACVKAKLPWIYGGAVMDHGATMDIIPGEGPCLRCLMPEPPEGQDLPTCASAGVLNPITGIIGNIEVVEALKLIVGTERPRKTYLAVSLWSTDFSECEVERDPACPCCGQRRFEFLERAPSRAVASLCGRDAFQVTPQSTRDIDLALVGRRLSVAGKVRATSFMLTLEVDGRELRLFRDGRAIIGGAKSRDQALSLYSEYFGAD